MPQITVIGRNLSRMLMTPTYQVLMPQDDESVDRWRSRLGFTIHVQSIGSLCWYRESQDFEQALEGRYSFVLKYSKDPVNHNEYVKILDKPKYLLVFRHSVPYESQIEAAFADSFDELAIYRSHFMSLMNYTELMALNKRISNMEDRLETLSSNLHTVAANLSDLVVQRLNQKASGKQPRPKKRNRPRDIGSSHGH